MNEPFFFGYGSLVNRATHVFDDAHPARLSGWRRAWRHTALRPVAYLTAVPYPGSEIDGLIAHVPANDWKALDFRERAYDRSVVTGAVHHEVTRPVEVQVYSIAPGKHDLPDATHPVLLSYIDVVVQGFLWEFGEAGVERFFDSTDGWAAPILNDRAEPVYLRAQRLEPHETELANHHLTRVGATLTDGA
ncbi:MAG: gamma-glutamylcyclotransferase [Rhodobacteraceae bacterium]|nr:gamma-glutamylcyclotransferase [Paracoccaceae bacterium]